MKQAPFIVQNFSTAEKIKIIVVLFFMGMLLILLGFLVGMLLRQTPFEFSPLVPATPTSSIAMVAPTDSLPAADCNSPTLTLGSTVFQIQALPRGADGSLAVPADTTGIAYRIEGTGTSSVFVLSPTPQNISVMSSISVGSAARVMGPGCSAAIYSLSAPQAGALDGSALTGRSAEEITVFFPTVSSGAGFVFKGRRTTEPVLDLDPPIENTLPPGVASDLPVENTSVSPTVVPTNVPPTLDCPTATFLLGTSTYQIQNLAVGSNGSLTISNSTPGIAYWLETEEGNNVIVLGATSENISLQNSITEKDTAEITSTDCSSMTYSLAVPELGSVKISTLPNQLTSGLTVFVQTDASGNGFVIRGEIAELTFPQ